jgi:hypothetical protein
MVRLLLLDFKKELISLNALRYMRIMAATYVGKMAGDTNMSYWGDQWAAEAVANFNLYGTLAEVCIYFRPSFQCTTEMNL